MPLNDLTMLAFTACNSLRVFAYAPQIVSVIRDSKGCSSISYATWGMFFIAHASAVAYALVNVDDRHMALIFTSSALCCLTILIVSISKRWRYSQARLIGNRHRFRAIFAHELDIGPGKRGGKAQSDA